MPNQKTDSSVLAAHENFPAISSELILSAAESTGLRCTGRYLQLNSMENRVFSVETESELHKNVIVKFYRPGRWSAETISSEQNMQKCLQDEDILTPALFELNANSVTSQTAMGDKPTLGKLDNLFFCVWQQIRGRTPLELDSDHLDEIGQTLARMHNLCDQKLDQNYFKRDAMSASRTGANTFYTIQDLPFIQTHFKIGILDLIEELTAKISWLDNQSSYFPIHNDLHRNNLMQTSDQGLFWILDFDDCCFGPAIQDLWLLAAGAESGTNEPMKELLGGYEKFRRLPPEQLDWVESLRTLKLIHYIGWIGKRWHADSLFRQTFSFFKEDFYWETTLNDLSDLNEKIGYS